MVAVKKVFIDGSAGTTGLRIAERLAARADIELLCLPEESRKDPACRRQMLNEADIAFFCLPDAAAKQAAAMIENDKTVVIDTSTAHRVDPQWVYGFPELGGRRAQIAGAKRIANPGCHASGFLALVAPLVQAGLLRREAKLCAFSLTGYSGGGKSMIAAYEAADAPALYAAPRQYGLGQSHKHLPEMQQISGLFVPPVFCPVVAPYKAGMEVTVPVFADDLNADKQQLEAFYQTYYQSGLVQVVPDASEDGFLSACAFAGKDTMQITVAGNDERLLLIARFDNLGKGACGAAIQNMNLVLGVAETTGLVL